MSCRDLSFDRWSLLAHLVGQKCPPPTPKTQKENGSGLLLEKWVWVKIKPPKKPLILVYLSMYRVRFWALIFDPQPNAKLAQRLLQPNHS